MSLVQFVEESIPSALRETKQRGILDTSLNIHEVALIYHYTDTGFETVNELLLQNNGSVTIPYAKWLSEALVKLPDFKDVVFRGTQLSQLQKLRYVDAFRQNIPISEPIFLSTSKSQLVANMFSKSNTLFTIFSKTGKEIEKFSKFGLESNQNEREVLFMPNCTFEVLSITDTDYQTSITLEQIL